MTELTASSTCPICGQDTPHHHTKEEVEQHQPTIASLLACCRHELMRVRRTSELNDLGARMAISIYERIIKRLERIPAPPQQSAETIDLGKIEQWFNSLPCDSLGQTHWLALKALLDVPQTSAEILEASEDLAGHQMVTVRSNRGDEYVIDADAAVKSLAQLFSDYDNEQRFGWTLSASWFEQELAKLRASSVARDKRNVEK